MGLVVFFYSLPKKSERADWKSFLRIGRREEPN